MAMELRHLRYFITVAEQKSFTRAADKLGIKQPPLSQQIQALETELGVQLLERLPRGVELTAAGAAYLREVRDVLERVAGANELARATAAGLEGSITVGFVNSAIAHAHVHTLIRTFANTYPKVRLKFAESYAAELIAAVAERTTDIAFVRNIVHRPPTLQYHKLGAEDVYLVLPKNHAALTPTRGSNSRNAPIAIAKLANDPFILVRRAGDTGLYTELLTLCESQGFLPTIAAEVLRVTTAIGLVAAGAGVSAVPSSMVGFGSAGVAFRPMVKAERLYSPLSMVTRADDIQPIVKNFIALTLAN
jgi:DNA-binding transcriptional LysR family regulator